MFVQARLAGRASHAGGFSVYDEYVPMVDKTVDVGWKEKHSTTQNSFGSTGWIINAFSLKAVILMYYKLNCILFKPARVELHCFFSFLFCL